MQLVSVALFLLVDVLLCVFRLDLRLFCQIQVIQWVRFFFALLWFLSWLNTGNRTQSILLLRECLDSRQLKSLETESAEADCSDSPFVGLLLSAQRLSEDFLEAELFFTHVDFDSLVDELHVDLIPVGKLESDELCGDVLCCQEFLNDLLLGIHQSPLEVDLYQVFVCLRIGYHFVFAIEDKFDLPEFVFLLLSEHESQPSRVFYLEVCRQGSILAH